MSFFNKRYNNNYSNTQKFWSNLADENPNITNLNTEQANSLLKAQEQDKLQGNVNLSNDLASLNAGMQILNAGMDWKYNNERNKLYHAENANIEAQAISEINQERNQLSKAIGDLRTQTANTRGIKSTSGAVQQNIEDSSKNLGEIENRVMKKVYAQQKMNMYNARVSKYANTANFFGSVAKSIFSVASTMNTNAGTLSKSGLGGK